MKTFIQAACAAMVLMWVGCNREPSVARVDPTPPAGSETMRFELELPAQSTAPSRGMAGTYEENYIQSIYILSFRVDPDDNTKEYYQYKTKAISVTDGVTSNLKSMTASVQKSDDKQRFVLVANAAGECSVLDDDALSGMTKEAVLEQLIFEHERAWYGVDSHFIPIPMWGESDQIRVNDGFNDTEYIKMVRMISRIDVLLSSQQAQEAFVFHSLHLYNYHERGRITPIRTSSHWDETDYRAREVSTPLTAPKVKGPHVIPAVTDNGETYIPTAYTFEATATDLDKASQATCVVVGGYFEGENEPTYYRIDFLEKDDNDVSTAFNRLLRNHAYRLSITSVSGSGYGTPDEAFNSKSINMDIEVLEWDDGDFTDIVYDNQYYLAVNPGEFYLGKNAQQNVFTVTTDYPGGWEPSMDSASASWITIDDWAYTGPNKKDDLTFSVDDNPGPGERTGYITITAGRLHYKVKIIQTDRSTLSLELLDADDNPVTELIFGCHHEDQSPITQLLKVRWTPDDENVTVGSVDLAAIGFNFTPGDNPLTSLQISGGLKSYGIKPPPHDRDRSRQRPVP